MWLSKSPRLSERSVKVVGTSHFSAPKRLGEERQNGGGTLGKGSQVSSGRQLGHREAEVRPQTGTEYLVKEKPGNDARPYTQVGTYVYHSSSGAGGGTWRQVSVWQRSGL